MRKNFIISTVGFLIVSTFVLYAVFKLNNKEIVTLTPDEGEAKVKPKDPGGIVIPHSDSLVYEKLNTNYVKYNKVHISPEPEEPLDIARNVESEAKLFDSIDVILENIEYYESKSSIDDLSDVDNRDYIMPAKLLTKQDQSSFDEETSAEKNVLVLGTELKVEKALEDRYKTMRVNVVEDQEQGYKIQLSTASSEVDAKQQWQQIQQKYYKILQSANLVTKKVDGKNERIFYLVMAGNYPSLNHAKMICTKLSLKRQSCIVTK